jgi:hypothetical protein
MLARLLILTTIVAIAGLSANLDNAEAFDQGTCNSWFNSDPLIDEELFDVDYVKRSAGSVDFGDGWHLGGSPGGNAVICWGSDGYVAIIGRLYADSPTEIFAGIEVTYYGSYGTYRTGIRGFYGQNGESSLVSPARQSYWHSRGMGHINSVAIRLYNCGASGSNCQDGHIATITRNRGD